MPGLFHQTHEHPEWIGRPLVDILYDLDVVLRRAMSMLRRYELHGCAQQYFETLSGGQQARFQILLLELSGATLLLLDEPTDNLDLVSAEALEVGLGPVRRHRRRRHPRPLVPARLRPLRGLRRRLCGHRPRDAPRPLALIRRSNQVVASMEAMASLIQAVRSSTDISPLVRATTLPSASRIIMVG